MVLGFLRRKSKQASEKFRGHSDQCYGHVTYAQSGEDMYLANIFSKLKISKPSYLDLGGHHPLAGSNTAWLYMHGSRGVVVEANPDLIEPFKKVRPEDKVINIGVGIQHGTLPFYRVDSWSGRNSFSKSVVDEFCRHNPEFKLYDIIEVDVFTINDIVGKYCGGKFPEFLSIDVEGKDYDILASADFVSNKPAVVCAEIITGANTSSLDKISSLMRQRGFVRYAETWGNAIFVDSKFSNQLGL